MIERAEVAVGAVVRHERHLLLIRRAKPPQAGRWSLPGGRVEPGERLREAVAREVREETGLTVDVGDQVGWVERIGEGHHYVILDFAATVAGSTALQAGDDAAEARWVALDEVASVDLVDGMLTFLREHGVVD